jgi:hypothetical protein
MKKHGKDPQWTDRGVMLLVLSLLSAVGIAASLPEAAIPLNWIAPGAQHCTLSSPPPDSGEEGFHELPARVFPRAKAIDVGFTGCQSFWARSVDGQWLKLASQYFEKGKLVAMSGYDTGPASSGLITCRYQAYQLLEGHKKCARTPPTDGVPMKSLAAGCYEEHLAARKARTPISGRCRVLE